MSDCTHRQCALCLLRECHKGEQFKQVDTKAVCHSCLTSAVNLYLDLARKFGGVHATDRPCGYARKS